MRGDRRASKGNDMTQAFLEEPFTFDLHGRRIQAALTKPSAGPAKWGIVIIPGSGPNDVDGNYPPDPMWPGRPHTYADLGRQLSGLGHAVLRYGRGDAVVVDDKAYAGHANFAERPLVVAETVRILNEKSPGLQGIAVAGHSEGSAVGSLLVARGLAPEVKAFVSLSGPALRFFDLMLRQVATWAKDGVLEFGGFKVPFALYEKSVLVVRRNEPVPDELRNVPLGFHRMPEDGKQYLRDYDACDNSALIAEVPCPVLIVQGGLDGSVFPENADRLAEARRSSPARTDKAFFPDLDHFYKRAQAGQPFARYDEQDVDERVSRAISDWLAKLLRSGPA